MNIHIYIYIMYLHPIYKLVMYYFQKFQFIVTTKVSMLLKLLCMAKIRHVGEHIGRHAFTDACVACNLNSFRFYIEGVKL